MLMCLMLIWLWTRCEMNSEMVKSIMVVLTRRENADVSDADMAVD
jgi:hypothetical protein